MVMSFSSFSLETTTTVPWLMAHKRPTVPSANAASQTLRLFTELIWYQMWGSLLSGDRTKRTMRLLQGGTLLSHFLSETFTMFLLTSSVVKPADKGLLILLA